MLIRWRTVFISARFDDAPVRVRLARKRALAHVAGPAPSSGRSSTKMGLHRTRKSMKRLTTMRRRVRIEFRARLWLSRLWANVGPSHCGRDAMDCI